MSAVALQNKPGHRTCSLAHVPLFAPEHRKKTCGYVAVKIHMHSTLSDIEIEVPMFAPQVPRATCHGGFLHEAVERA
jgi:hypothetical protein